MVYRRFKMLYLCMGQSPIQDTNVDLAIMPSLLMCWKKFNEGNKFYHLSYKRKTNFFVPYKHFWKKSKLKIRYSAAIVPSAVKL